MAKHSYLISLKHISEKPGLLYFGFLIIWQNPISDTIQYASFKECGESEDFWPKLCIFFIELQQLTFLEFFLQHQMHPF